MSIDDSKILIRDVIRGDKQLSDLQAIGIRITLNKDSVEIENPRKIIYSAEASDVATGLVKNSGDRDVLMGWASVLLAGSVFVNLDGLSSDEGNELLLEALWDASFGKPVGSEAMALARVLSRS